MRWHEPWLVGGEQSKESTDGGNALGVAHVTMTVVRGSHLLVTMQNMPSAARGEAVQDPGLEIQLPCLWVCSEPPH